MSLDFWIEAFETLSKSAIHGQYFTSHERVMTTFHTQLLSLDFSQFDLCLIRHIFST